MDRPPADAVPEQRELAELAAELYVLRPDAFAAARDAAVRKARAEKQTGLARELGALRRPTQSAWLINLLWHAQRADVERYFQLADDLSRAQAQGAVAELQQLTARRRELEDALAGHVHKLAEQEDVSLAASTEREIHETLTAALTLPAVANEMRTGRLLKAATYAGFGTFPDTAPPGRATAASPPPSRSRGEAPAARPDQQDQEESKRRIETARKELEAAAAALAEHESALPAASSHRQELVQQIEQLNAQLRHLKQEVATVERDLLTAKRRRDEAAKARDAALRALERAEPL